VKAGTCNAPHSTSQKKISSLEYVFHLLLMRSPVWGYWCPIGCLPRWRIGERSPDMEGTREIKYPGQTKTSTAALRLAEGSVKARGRKPRKKNHLVLQVGGYAKGQLHIHVKQLLARNSQRRNGTGRFNGCRWKWVQRNMSGIKNWIACVQDRGKWKDVEKVKTFNR